jgi:carbonic anhydrase/acetyltransferase-like protein (isoleucine patch superfamily)
MPRRRHSDETDEVGYSLASAALRALGHGCLLVAAGMGMASLFGTAAMGISEIAVAAVIGMGCMIGADTIRDTAILASAKRKRQASDEQYREDAAVDAFVREMEADQVKHAPEHRRQGLHVARIARERQNRFGGTDVGL